MHSLQMFLELAANTELAQTMSADVRSVGSSAEMSMHVLTEVLSACECLGTRRAGVRLVAVVQLDVATQVPDACEQHATDATAELHHAVVVTDEVRLRVLHVVRLHCTTTNTTESLTNYRTDRQLLLTAKFKVS